MDESYLLCVDCSHSSPSTIRVKEKERECERASYFLKSADFFFSKEKCRGSCERSFFACVFSSSSYLQR